MQPDRCNPIGMAGISKLRPPKRQLFPEKLFDLVNKPNSGIQWSPDGTKIEVERTQLERSIADKFRSQNYDSFIRQLHFYGFRKSGNSYYHEKFQRDNPGQLQSMRRKYSNPPLDNADLNEDQIEQQHQQQQNNLKTLRHLPRHEEPLPLDARKSTLESRQLTSASKSQSVSIMSLATSDGPAATPPPAHENRPQLAPFLKLPRPNYSAQNYAFYERRLPPTAFKGGKINYSRPIIMYTLDEQPLNLNASLNSDNSVGSSGSVSSSSNVVSAGSSTSSFTTIRSDVTQASIADNMLQIEIPHFEAGTDGPKWPKTLVLENFSRENGGLITAYWVQSG